jgi:hypothetical protein
MAARSDYRLVLAEPKGVAEPQVGRPAPPRGLGRLGGPTLDPRPIAKALKATAGSREIIAQIPGAADPSGWVHVATFCVCVKAGTAKYLDIWDADHFDYVTDMANCLAQCRAWFSAGGYGYWGSAQTKTGRINCYFNAPAQGNYVCNAELRSDGGPAQVECLIDAYNFGPLPFNGYILQPHMSSLAAGGHSFRIRQLDGAFSFLSLTVWRV